jgi:beta-mannosidase
MHFQTLNGMWELAEVGDEATVSVRVPGNLHNDLVLAGMISDPFCGEKETKAAWVAEADWRYHRDFYPDAEVLAADKIFLECDGLDTLATIVLNGRIIAKTDNMFRRYSFDVTDAIVQGENRIEILFDSPVRYAKRMLDSDPSVITPGDSIKGSPFLRKAAYQWGWDWAPKLPTSGIWRSIRLAGCSSARLRDLRTSQTHEPGKAAVRISTRIESFSEDEYEVRCDLISPNGTSIARTANPETRDGEVRFTFEVDHPNLWWPNGLGDHPLYDLNVTLLGAGRELDSKQLRIGLRSIELRRDPDEWGESFAFAVNGVPVFCKGANWVPADQFPSRITDERYRGLISCAVEANMNMLRVWGGGFYEDDRFYDLCDENGILVWQDFMFACAHYPSDGRMLENISAEAVDNIRRIRHHPCLALWCGNNEMEWAFDNPKWDSADHRRAYSDLFHRILPEICEAEDPCTPYWPSSPSSGTPFTSQNAEYAGDGHYWDVWHGRKPFTAYRDHYYRFMSEFGFESLPPMGTIREYVRPEDWNLTSPAMESHQKKSDGNELILYYLAKTLRIPGNLPMMSYASQVLQAEAMRYGVEHWRRNRNGCRCMGTLYWQFNDCWPASSWAGIDYRDRWKALHYAAKRFYAPVLLSAEEGPSSARLHVTNDMVEPFKGKVRWALEYLNGVQIIDGEIDIEIPGLSNVLVKELSLEKWLNDENRREVVLAYSLWRDGMRISMGIASFVPPKQMELPEAGLSYDVEEKNGDIEILIAGQYTARFVRLEIKGYDTRFSDNYFDLPAGRMATVKVLNPEGLTAEEIGEKLSVISLRDTYSFTIF